MAVGRLDWWKIKGEHTPFEWALQIAADSLDPIGEERADLRAAIHTANLMSASLTSMTNEQFAELVQRLTTYMKPPDEGLDNVEEVLALMKAGD